MKYIIQHTHPPPLFSKFAIHLRHPKLEILDPPLQPYPFGDYRVLSVSHSLRSAAPGNTEHQPSMHVCHITVAFIWGHYHTRRSEDTNQWNKIEIAFLKSHPKLPWENEFELLPVFISQFFLCFSDRLSTSQLLHRLVLYRSFGQPAAQTHPHLLRNGEVTPGVTQDEFRLRRHRLMEFINRQTAIKSQKPHLVVIPSAGKQFMTHDIPYPFRQNTDFLYLSGFLEPSSLLVLESHPHEELPSHKSTLFVPKRDVTKELWEGPRSGIDGAIELTGVDQAFNIDDFDKYINKFLSKNSSFTLWYDFRKPAHPEFHAKYITNLLRENKLSGVESIRTLVQALRVFKSPAEVELMQKSCLIASQAFKEVMKFSHAEVSQSVVQNSPGGMIWITWTPCSLSNKRPLNLP